MNKIRKKLKLMDMHALVNVSCSGNKVWSEMASKEIERRKKSGK